MPRLLEREIAGGEHDAAAICGRRSGRTRVCGGGGPPGVAARGIRWRLPRMVDAVGRVWPALHCIRSERNPGAVGRSQYRLRGLALAAGNVDA